VSSPAVSRIRPATDADAPAIRALIREAQLNPRDLDWRRFLVADEAGTVVACAQVRVHGGGIRELASVAVRKDRRGGGVGRAISEAAIAREPVRPLYLYAEARNEPFWERLGFRTVTGVEIPLDMRAALRLARLFMAIGSVILRRRLRLVVMRRDDP
jgi:N-acetylglutamate synthase-like GNAT family acetyltransferase